MKEPKSNFASSKCQGQNKDTILRQKLNDFIVWIMYDASCAWDQLEIQKPHLCCQNWQVVPFKPFFILSNEIFKKSLTF